MDVEFKVVPWGDLSTSDPTESDFKIKVIVNGQDAGYGCFFHQNFKIYCQEVEIYPIFQRKGIATRLYNYAEQISGKSVSPTGDIDSGLNESGEDAMSLDAQKFWKNRIKT